MTLRASSPELSVQAGAVATGVFGEAPVRAEEILRGVMTYKFAVELPSGERYVVRFYPASRAHVVHYEPDAIRRLAGAGIPVPTVVADSRTGPPTDLAYIVYRFIPGEALGDRVGSLGPSACAGIAPQLMTYFEAMGDLSVHGFGELVDSRMARYRSWDEYLQTSFTAGLRAIADGLFPADVSEGLRDLAERLDRFPPPQSSTLAWGDVSLENILVDGRDRVVALVDFEGLLGAETLLHLGYFFAAHGSHPLLDLLSESWPGGVGAEERLRLNLYSVLRVLTIAPYLGSPLPTGHPRGPVNQVFPGLAASVRCLLEDTDGKGQPL